MSPRRISYQDEKREAKRLFTSHGNLLSINKLKQEKIGAKTISGNLSKLCRYGIYYGLLRSKRQKIEERDLRDLWYVIKPFLQVHDPDSNQKNWTRTMSQKLSKQLSKMVLRGTTSYEELKIRDADRKRKLPTSQYNTGQWDHILLFCEKNTTFRHLDNLPQLLKIPVIAGGGQESTALIEEVVKWIENQVKKEETYLILAWTDYDYYGYSIYQSLAERARKLGYTGKVKRIGINPTQIPADKREGLAYRPPQSKKKERQWVQEYGWKGKYGFEVQSISDKTELRRILGQKLLEYADPDNLYQYRKQQRWKRLPDKISDLFIEEDDKIRELEDKIEDLREDKRQRKRLIQEILEEKGLLEEIKEDLKENKKQWDDRPDYPENYLLDKIEDKDTRWYDWKYRNVDDITEDVYQEYKDRVKQEEINEKAEKEGEE